MGVDLGPLLSYFAPLWICLKRKTWNGVLWFFSFGKVFLFSSESSKRMQITFKQSSFSLFRDVNICLHPTPPPSLLIPVPCPLPTVKRKREEYLLSALVSFSSYLNSRVDWALRTNFSFAFVRSFDAWNCWDITKLSWETLFCSPDERTPSWLRRKALLLYL